MNTSQQNAQEKLLTLQQAAEKLGVTPQVLLSWNDYQILKPTITVTGQIGYTQQQIDQFLHIYEAFRPLETQPVPLPTHQFVPPNRQSATYQPPTPLTPSEVSSASHKNPPLRVVASLLLLLIVLTGGIFTQQEHLLALLNQFATSQKPSPSAEQISNLALGNTLPTDISQQKTNDYFAQKDVSDLTSRKSTNIATTNQTSSTNTTSSHSDKVPTATVAGALKYLADKKPVNSSPTNDFYTFASTITRPTGTLPANSPFDKSGNIAGTTHTNVLAMSYESPDILGNNTTGLINNNPRNQIILIAIASAGMLLYVARKPKKNFVAVASEESDTSDKILEVDQKMDGTVVLKFQGKDYKISKPELDSDSDQFIAKLMKLVGPGHKEIEYDTFTEDRLKFSAPLSRLVTRLGFVGVKRDLFFPRTSKNRVLFRKYITRQDLRSMKINTDQLLRDLNIAL